MYQVCHDDCIHDDRLRGGSQGELEATWGLSWTDIKTMTLQQEVLQLILGCYNILHLQPRESRQMGVYFHAAQNQHQVTLNEYLLSNKSNVCVWGG